MAVKAKAPARARPRARHEPTSAEHLNDALMHLLKAVPVGHLDERMTKLEKWLVNMEKDVAKAFGPQRTRTVTRTAGPARRRTTTRVTPRNRTVAR